MKAWVTKDGYGRVELHLAVPKRVGLYWTSSSKTEIPDQYRDDFLELIQGGNPMEMEIIQKGGEQ